MKGVVQVVAIEDMPPHGPLMVGRLARGVVRLQMEAVYESTIFKIRELLDEDMVARSEVAAPTVIRIVVEPTSHRLLMHLVNTELVFTDQAHADQKRLVWRPTVV